MGVLKVLWGLIEFEDGGGKISGDGSTSVGNPDRSDDAELDVGESASVPGSFCSPEVNTCRFPGFFFA